MWPPSKQFSLLCLPNRDPSLPLQPHKPTNPKKFIQLSKINSQLNSCNPKSRFLRENRTRQSSKWHREILPLLLDSAKDLVRVGWLTCRERRKRLVASRPCEIERICPTVRTGPRRIQSYDRATILKKRHLEKKNFESYQLPKPNSTCSGIVMCGRLSWGGGSVLK
jgi:hypothetical protein